jgi:hypothetical protein
MKPTKLLGLVLELGAVSGAYLRFGRPRVLNWGARPDEIERGLDGDDVLPDASLQTTRAMTVDAPPEAIWPWLVQMGPRPRAGAYTYDWIERLLGIDIENGDRILPEFQHVEPGDFMGLNEKGDGLRVVSVKPERSLVLQWVPQNSTWAFVLQPEDGRTRLISRNRLRAAGLPSRVFMAAFMEPGSLVMERKMLLGIKERAERQAKAGSVQHAAAAPGGPQGV